MAEELNAKQLKAIAKRKRKAEKAIKDQEAMKKGKKNEDRN